MTSGTIPADTVVGVVEVAMDQDGSIWVSSDESLPRDSSAQLKAWGVTTRRSRKRFKLNFQEYDSWLQILPLRADLPLQQVADRTQVLFVLKDDNILPDLVNEILRQGNDRQSFRRVELGGDECVLLRVIGAPFYSLLRATEQWAGDRLTAFIEHSARIWVEAGYRHPLVDRIAPAPGQHLLIQSDGTWQHLKEHPFQDIYQAIDFQLPEATSVCKENQETARLQVPVSLARSSSPEAAEVFVITRNAIEQLERFVQSSSDSVLERLAFAVAETQDASQPIVVLRVRPGRSARPVLVFDGLACRNYLKIPNLFVPLGMKIHPPLRRDAVRKLLASNESQLVWLTPIEADQERGVTHSFQVQSLPDSSFLPLSNWVDYILDRDQEVLTAWRQSHQFDFEDFICQSDKQVEKKKAEPQKQARERRSSSKSDLGQEEETQASESNVEQRIQQFRKAARRSPEDERVVALKQELESTEEAFLAMDGPLEDPERIPVWDRMADLNAQLGRFSDSSICRQHQFWESSENQPHAMRLWFLTEVESATKLGRPGLVNENDIVTDRELRRVLKADKPSPADASQLAAWIACAKQNPTEYQLLRRQLPAIQKYLEQHETGLAVRSCWLAWRTLAELNHDELLLARSRDRILERMYAHGLTADRDLPSFLRLGNSQSGDRVRQIRENVRSLHETVCEWSEKNLGVSSISTQHYIDLIFAFAFARLGESSEATTLVNDVEQKLLKKHDPIHHWLFDAYRCRIRQVLSGESASGPFPDDLMQRLESISKLDLYKIDRLRQHSGILEPVEKLDPYREWRRRDEEDLEKQLADLFVEKDRQQLQQKLDSLLGRKQSSEDHVRVLATALELSTRLGEDFASELLQQIEEVESRVSDPIQKAELLEKGLLIGAHYDHSEAVQNCFSRMTQLLSSQKKAEPATLEALGALLSRSFFTLRKMGMRDEIAVLLEAMSKVVRDSRKQKRGDTERLRILLQLAGGWFYFGQDQGWKDIDVARELLLCNTLTREGHVGAKKQTDLAISYIEAVGQAPLQEAVDRLNDLFHNLSGIRDGQTVNSHYSLKQLDIVEALVQTVVSDSFTMDPHSQRWMDDEEFLIRRRIHSDMKRMIETQS